MDRDILLVSGEEEKGAIAGVDILGGLLKRI
jgi:hypothetical protein